MVRYQPSIIWSATSFLPLWGQSIIETPEDWKSERKDASSRVTSMYALNEVILPYACAAFRMLVMIFCPGIPEKVRQFSVQFLMRLERGH